MLEALDLIMLEDQLAHHVVRIEFDKVDGSRRTMICTKNPSIITEAHMPTQHPLSADSVPPTPDYLLKVFDTEKQGWRSMRKANIVSWELTS